MNRVPRSSPDVTGRLDLARPNAARMYDYYLGGSANVAVDRAAADELIRCLPDTVFTARANRSFLSRVVRFLAQQGIDQFLDLGSGIPTAGNVHEIAQAVNPEARVAYVDIEPVAVSYAQKLLRDEKQVTITKADIRKPSTVLAAPGVTDLLDFTRPVAVLAVFILHSMSDADRPLEFMAEYRAACVPSSYLAISHLSPQTWDPQEITHSLQVYARTPTPVTYRDRAEILRFMTGYDLVEPGLVLLPDWRPDDPPSERDAPRANSYGAVGRLT
ncbi:MAG TPA: SAM-dependent methyltransferase [Pseudonocardiaceae bacterium]|nr:SAM-dependent methyltransferase [Pseudonocardiaceae bacterium]